MSALDHRLKAIRRSEERRVGKSVDHCVTGVQTCALPISLRTAATPSSPRRPHPTKERRTCRNERTGPSPQGHPEIGRASCRKECRSLCDWSSDVCSSDLAEDGGYAFIAEAPAPDEGEEDVQE